MNQFSESDIKLLENKGIPQPKVKEQIETFKDGIPFVKLVKAAIVDDGISRFSADNQNHIITAYEADSKGLSLLKFVPASGAASRMFKALFNFLSDYKPSDEELEAYFERTNDTALKVFSDQMSSLPFYTIAQNRIEDKGTTKGEKLHLFVKELLSEEGLNYGFYPKGLLPFHTYGKLTVTPFCEHLLEGSLYAKTGDSAKLHFTISEQHNDMFKEEFSSVEEQVSTYTKTKFEVDYSYQKASTDTIAVDMDNKPFRNSDGSLLFRPGGHGALIENLNEQDADIIFIKNIDNVVVEKYANQVSDSKKVLAGVLLKVQKKAFEYAKRLDVDTVSAELLEEIKSFLQAELNVRFSNSFSTFSLSEQIAILKDKIARPIRVCGMVKNEGEPGGGPFWIEDSNGNVSLQIVESAQIDDADKEQMNILKNSTHFNPVDLVCGIRNYKGEKYDLLNFVDPKQGFITEKTKEGRALKALELPGLWNGAMAFWNTIFVEVPLVTFNPVKTVNDLLKPSHQE